ncbi:DUF1194 domain-containing protein [Elioraea sp.]|uniref:DUF1194 domain-containing protein n=1 Tax=Elioraea sp. TaxID=2185103 RepID=UPI0025BFF97E|nr:DUF1194 domain-containing protein [Elioraea sp.]
MPPTRRSLLAAPFLPVLPVEVVPVDLALVLAVDVSASVDYDEFGLMIAGYAAAFRDADLVARATAGAQGAIAVAMLFWAGPGARDLAIPWMRIADQAGAEAVAAAIEAAPRTVRPGATALGEALLAAAALAMRSPWPAARRVIDVSGDGPANAGIVATAGRDGAATLGITVNALAIVHEEPELEAYYAAEVITGPGAFVQRAENYEDFAEAIGRKLLREVGGALIA